MESLQSPNIILFVDLFFLLRDHEFQLIEFLLLLVVFFASLLFS